MSDSMIPVFEPIANWGIYQRDDQFFLAFDTRLAIELALGGKRKAYEQLGLEKTLLYGRYLRVMRHKRCPEEWVRAVACAAEQAPGVRAVLEACGPSV